MYAISLYVIYFWLKLRILKRQSNHLVWRVWDFGILFLDGRTNHLAWILVSSVTVQKAKTTTLKQGKKELKGKHQSFSKVKF